MAKIDKEHDITRDKVGEFRGIIGRSESATDLHVSEEKSSD